MKKTYNPDIINELAGGSSFFQAPQAPQTQEIVPEKEKTVEAPLVPEPPTQSPTEFVRSRLKVFGKEAVTHRFTPEEKKDLEEIMYQFKTQGVRVSENEIARMAINYFIADYRKLGTASILSSLLKKIGK